MRRSILLLILCVCGPVFVASGDTAEDREPDRIVEDGENGSTWIRTDRDSDGNYDHNLQINEAGRKIYEELDFNYDGSMDDFYHYTDGVLKRREIDSNYDGRTDIWVYIHEGVYIKRYEQDSDHDGEIDEVREFGTDSEDDEGS